MNKIFLLAAIALFSFGGIVSTASAAVDQGNGNPLLVTQAWGLTQEQTVTVSEGAVIVDEAGLVSVCTFFQGCSDITMTAFYRDARIETARQLIENGRLQYFPGWTYWAQFVK